MFKWYIFTLLSISLPVFGQSDQVWLHPNRGQWGSGFNYKVELDAGNMYLDQKGFTYQFWEMKEHEHHGKDNPARVGRSHVIKTHFQNAHAPASMTEGKPSSFYRNYFLSNDPQNWKSKVHSVQKVTAHGLYTGVDLEVEGGSSSLKYSWIVAPNTDPGVIRWSYDGAESVTINEEGQLIIRHSLGMITEGRPVAWITQNGKKQHVPVAYSINGKTVSFDLKGKTVFDDTLVLDPSLTFSTFTGSLVDNWGFTAAPDPSGNLYAAGVAFGAGYPITTGAFDGSFNGGTFGSSQPFDAAITKFNASGTALLYSTYLGGGGNETPHSLVSNTNGELFVLGVTSSSNFPMAGASFDNSFNGGPVINSNSLNFQGSDLYVARFSADGSSLIASTFLGGTGTDGLNDGSLNYNYGDPFRGEIIVAGSSVYIASSTKSANFPLVNAAQTFLNGQMDAVIVKMNLGLSSVLWSTYFGGAGSDTGNGIALASTGNVYISGGTTSASLPFASGHDLTYNGGASDGYLLRLNGNSGAVLSGTYMGTSEYDQSYFVQLDQEDQVYVLGQTEGPMPVSAGCYGNPNSGQYIKKYSADLSAQTWSTVVGAGTGHVEISPTAFLVSNCGDIYLSGWGGETNDGSQAQFSTSYGFPVTPDAFQSTTNGSNFWIGVLGPDASQLKYSTFMGGLNSSPGSSPHVDGGTSRFDKNGSIYHAVCGSCGSSTTGFTTTPGVWSPTDQSQNCNLAAFKFELSKIEAIVSDPDPVICLPDPAVFDNNSVNGNEFFWDFGDNTTSTEVNPSHVYSGSGTFTVTLIVTDSNECFTPDTAQFIVIIGDFEAGIIQPPGSICPGEPYQFEAFGGISYQWSPAAFLNDPTVYNPIATIAQSTVFTCIISDSCGIDTIDVLLPVFDVNVQISNDTSICIGSSVPLGIQGVASASWTPPAYLDNPNSLNPVSTPDQTITYMASGTTGDGCAFSETVTITVVPSPPAPVMPDTLRYCEGLSGTVSVSGGDSYAWSPPVAVTPVSGPVVTISTDTEQYYYCDFINACGAVTDSIYVSISEANVTAGNDTIVCPGETAFMWVEGAVSYVWEPAAGFVNSSGSLVSVNVFQPTVFKVTGQDMNGCYDSSQVFIDLFPQPFIQTCPDVYAFIGEEIQLSATSTTPGAYVWTPSEHLSCVVCAEPTAQPDAPFQYTVSYVDANGCSASDVVNIFYDPIIYVPNAFTPDGSEVNDTFFALGGNIGDFRMEIFNRWGELVYTGGALDKSWDGTYAGIPSPDGIYTWKITYKDFSGKTYEMVGHTSLLR